MSGVNARAYSVQRFRLALLQFVGGRVAQAVARALLVLILVRILEIRDFGAYMLIVGAAEMLLQVGSLGILPVAQRYLPQLLTTLSPARLYAFVSVLAVAQAAVLAGFAWLLWTWWPVLAPLFGMDAAQAEATRFAAWLFLVIPAFRFSTEMLEAMLGQGATARAVMVFARVAAVLVLIAVKPAVTLTDVLLIDLIAIGACTLFIWWNVRRLLASLHNPQAVGRLPIREMLRFAGHMALVGPMSATASPGAIRLVLASGLGLAASGLYAFLQSLERLVSRYLPATLLKNLIRPVLISRYSAQGDNAVLKAGTGLLLKSNLMAVIAGLVFIAVCGDQLVLVMSGGKFPGAGITLLLLYVNMIATSQRGVQEMVMQITGHAKMLWITSLVYPIALLLVWLLADYGLNVAVLIVIAGSLAANGLAARVLQQRTNWFRVDWRGMSAIIVPGLVAASAGIALTGWARPFIAASLAVLVFVLLVRIGRPFSTVEIGTVERVVGQRAGRVLRGFAV